MYWVNFFLDKSACTLEITFEILRSSRQGVAKIKRLFALYF